MRERPLRDVPRPVLVLLAGALALQIGWHAATPRVGPVAKALPEPPPQPLLRVAALGDPVTAAKLLMLWLQAFDNQPGLSVPFRALDYVRVEQWLDRILDLDPRARYPLLAAAHLYALVPDPVRQRRMLEFLYRRFLERPDARWRWLAHAALVAKHRLQDLPLALRYARALTEHATGPDVPYWARDMTLIILTEMEEWEAAKGLVGALLESGTISDPAELAFLRERLAELEAAHAGE